MNTRLACAPVCLASAFVAIQACAHQPAVISPGPSAPASVQTATPSAMVHSAPAEWVTIGKSLQGRPIRMRKLGHGPRAVMFIGGIHGDEPEGATATAALPEAFTAAALSDTVSLYIVEDINPDGRAAATRENANQVDINRNFPAKNFDPANPAGGGSPVSQPETRAIVETIDRIAPQLVIVLHSWNSQEFINFDGPAQALAERFSLASGLPVKASGEFAPTPGSLGSYFGRDRGIPVLTVEFRKGSDPEKDWLQIQTAVLQAIRGG